MIKVFRFSTDGFKPQYQSYHVEQVKHDLAIINNENNIWDRLKDLPSYTQQLIKEGAKSHIDQLNPQWQEETTGLWLFVHDLTAVETKLQLNHLSAQAKEAGEWHCQSLPLNTQVYPAGKLWQGNKITLQDCYIGQAVFLPTSL